MWGLIAHVCALPTVFHLIVRLSMRRPYLHLGDYMRRFWLIPFSDWLPFSIRVHHIMRPDADDDLHDHPWNWRTIILHGWYVEEDVFGQHAIRSAGNSVARSAETFHRVTQVSDGGVWTLFIMGKKRNRWGFMTGSPPRKTYYREYFSINTKDGPQE